MRIPRFFFQCSTVKLLLVGNNEMVPYIKEIYNRISRWKHCSFFFRSTTKISTFPGLKDSLYDDEPVIFPHCIVFIHQFMLEHVLNVISMVYAASFLRLCFHKSYFLFSNRF